MHKFIYTIYNYVDNCILTYHESILAQILIFYDRKIVSIIDAEHEGSKYMPVRCAF